VRTTFRVPTQIPLLPRFLSTVLASWTNGRSLSSPRALTRSRDRACRTPDRRATARTTFARLPSRASAAHSGRSPRQPAECVDPARLAGRHYARSTRSVITDRYGETRSESGRTDGSETPGQPMVGENHLTGQSPPNTPRCRCRRRKRSAGFIGSCPDLPVCRNRRPAVITPVPSRSVDVLGVTAASDRVRQVARPVPAPGEEARMARGRGGGKGGGGGRHSSGGRDDSGSSGGGKHAERPDCPRCDGAKTVQMNIDNKIETLACPVCQGTGKA
jgi:hypothetical protein